MEIKSRLMLPRDEEEEDQQVEDPRHDMVQRLLEYKKYKDAASMLEERSQEWQRRFARRADDLPSGRVDPAEQPIQEVELWDLVSAFARVLRNNTAVQPSAIRYDDTPIEVYMDRISERMATGPRLAFSSLFEQNMVRSQLVGIFLAVLELIRHHRVQVEQECLFDEIWISAAESDASAHGAEDEDRAA